jgi:hypothetical protein
MNSVRVITMMDEELLESLERLPANKVLAMINAVTEQVRSAVSYVKEDAQIPGELSAMTFMVGDLTVFSSVQDHGDVDPRTHVRQTGKRFIENVLQFPSDDND